ncbi:hypothetical protein [Ferroacidibacillus organovorans]|uniref:Stage III sporulation protein AG n=1 Tax=Ferroacidibacillus organovorans TaxID=1765683 RepID=A0A101XSK4_9BACL|nr:hypothetical protein [Ferroacidibacillus organovorans]KUO96779.1 hypothetical protein ATW55_08130 [Ferroacidibacillus organovorans]
MQDLVRRVLANKWLVALLAIGLLLLAFGASGGTGSGGTPGNGAAPVSAVTVGQTTAAKGTTFGGNTGMRSIVSYENYLNAKLAHMIDQISGISNALVMVTVDSTPIAQYGQNTTTSRQTSSQQGTGAQTSTTTITSSNQLVMSSNASGGNTPVVIDEQMPHISGVFVIAKAADTVQMQAEITNAVQDALGIPSYEITVLPRR